MVVVGSRKRVTGDEKELVERKECWERLRKNL